MDDLRLIYSNDINQKTIEEVIPRNITQIKEIESDVRKIIDDVKNNGDTAIIKYTKEFDKIQLEKKDIKVNKAEIQDSYESIDDKLLSALKFAKENLIKFHKAQLKDEWYIDIANGVKAGQIYRPIESIGIYIPGGKAIYPSTVLMAATPAYVAGVEKVIVCSPPQKNGKIAPEVLVAANEFNIKDIYKVGGVQAIAAMAYGTDTIPAVQKVVGPGNKWVNAAKQILSNIIAIDNPAGPSDILIIADDSIDYNYVILDFISQIEHDPDNIGIIITISDSLIDNIKNNLDSYIEKSERKEIIKSALKNSLLIKATNIEECIRISNLIAPEHLEILIKNPKEILSKIINAGAIFLGPYSPVPLGDYSAGTNHILPTGGYAKTYSGLNTYDFLKMIDVLECTQQGLINLGDSAMIIAEFEKLNAHRDAIKYRLKKKK